ncbi:hypothetical protein PAXRUDRAFT_257452 [Paxillus rubicundulus Ve08.2h10]|uniref:Uncharacterized protein n=1 Tax=Paxillus rubicundulus Ve08.2h10 TaxID=930991 RepID=A0A0D0D8E6_9AGAM|nr:hypothetical protein PAXRUDRAFT_257452 [Paxillus rubicundulus Ve08.2h10]
MLYSERCSGPCHPSMWMVSSLILLVTRQCINHLDYPMHYPGHKPIPSGLFGCSAVDDRSPIERSLDVVAALLQSIDVHSQIELTGCWMLNWSHHALLGVGLGRSALI